VQEVAQREGSSFRLIRLLRLFDQTLFDVASVAFRNILLTPSIVVHEEGESLPNTRRSRPSLNDDPSLCATLYTVGGVGELYQRRSSLL
jgi:hypothetical protein